MADPEWDDLGVSVVEKIISEGQINTQRGEMRVDAIIRATGNTTEIITSEYGKHTCSDGNTYHPSELRITRTTNALPREEKQDIGVPVRGGGRPNGEGWRG